MTVAVGEGNTVTVEEPQGELARSVPPAISIRQDGDVLVVERPDDQRQNRACTVSPGHWWRTWSPGVTNGFSKELRSSGSGAGPKGPSALELALGFSHPVNVAARTGSPSGALSTRIIVKGIDKEKVGQVAADIRKLASPSPTRARGSATR